MIVLLFLFFFNYVEGVCLEGQCTLATGQCLNNAVEGNLCEECSYQGYVSNNECICTSSQFDPSNFCLPVVSTKSLVDVYINFGDAECTCYTDWDDGFFKLSAVEKKYVNSELQFVYGDIPNPAVCNECYNEFYGPKPETVTASRVSFNITACTVYGGIDISLLPTDAPVPDGRRVLEQNEQWYECANHGTWNSTRHGCECDIGWGLSYVGQGYNGEIFLCNVCVGPWGPPTPAQQEAIEDLPFGFFCSVPYTPDPLDGVLKECSGHGVYEFGECQCTPNWALANYTLTEKTILLIGDETYDEMDVDYTVLTCIACLPGYSVADGCTVFRTPSPSDIPTINPSRNPTFKPTKNPTVNPSKHPTMNPSLTPSHNPTRNPTLVPSRNPTKNPTLNPTKTPSKNPTLNPSKTPTVNPSLVPTRNPSRVPTFNPSRTPTFNPSLAPTKNPSKIPTFNPTLVPSLNPSRNPTINPTKTPSRNPTVNPSKVPTFNPSLTPSLNPTVNPTSAPTKNPSLSPTKNPTSNPTTKPTRNPSFNPTLNPTRNPTKKPTQNPTKNPSKNPSRNPTRNPTKNPSKNPSRNPTKKPTTNPTINPTVNPVENNARYCVVGDCEMNDECVCNDECY